MRNKSDKVFTVTFRINIMQESDVCDIVYFGKGKKSQFACKY